MTKEEEIKLSRMLKKIKKTKTCWIWTGGTNGKGYGRVFFNGVMRGAHAVMLHLSGVKGVPLHYKKGDYAKLVVDHTCKNPSCVNPKHLRIITNSENVLCGSGLTAINKRKTHCLNGHKLTEDNCVRSQWVIGYRRCKICVSSRKKKYTALGYDRRYRIRKKQQNLAAALAPHIKKELNL